MRVRIRRFRRDDQGCPQSSGLIQRPCHWHPMLPIEKALVGYLALSGVVGSNVLFAVECRPSVRPFMAARSRCSCLSGHLSAPGLLFTSTASADFPPGYPVGISLGKNTDYDCTTPPFTQNAPNSRFRHVVLSHPDAGPYMMFLFVGSQPRLRLPSRDSLRFRSCLRLLLCYGYLPELEFM